MIIFDCVDPETPEVFKEILKSTEKVDKKPFLCRHNIHIWGPKINSTMYNGKFKACKKCGYKKYL